MHQLAAQLRVVVAYCNGSTQVQIAASHGMHVQTVRARLREAGVFMHEQRAALSFEERESMRRLHRNGQSARQLARRYGVTHTTVLRLLKSST